MVLLVNQSAMYWKLEGKAKSLVFPGFWLRFVSFFQAQPRASQIEGGWLFLAVHHPMFGQQMDSKHSNLLDRPNFTGDI